MRASQTRRPEKMRKILRATQVSTQRV